MEKLYELLGKDFSSRTTDSPQAAKKRPLGSMKDKVGMTDDWDSDEVNEEIARLFNDGPAFPEED